MNDRTVAVAGASGFVGRSIVRELLSRGWGVRGLVRDKGRAVDALPDDARVELVQGDSVDAAALDELLHRASACVNAIGLLREAGGGQTFKKVHVDTTRALTEACQRQGVRRFVQVSALGVSDEGKSAYQKTKWEAEQIVGRSRLEWTIFRPSLIHGADSGFIKLVKGWVTGHKQPWFFLPYFTRGVRTSDVPLAAIRRESARVSPVLVDDVAWAVGEALERREAIGEVYNLAGPDTFTWPQLLRTIREYVPDANPQLEPLGVPAEAAAAQARVARKLGLGSLLPFDEGMALMGASDSTASLDKPRTQLGFSPRPFVSTFKTYASRIA